MSQSVSYLTLHFPGMLDADCPFAWKDKVILFKDGSAVFRGIAMDPQRTGSGDEEGITVQFADPWWYLSNGTITQVSYDGSITAAARTGTLTTGSAMISAADLTHIVVGMTVVGTGIPLDSTVVSLGTGTFTISAVATASGDQTLSFAHGSASNRKALFALLHMGYLGAAFSHVNIGDELANIIGACDLDHGSGVIQFGAASGPAYSIMPQPIDVQGTFETAVHAALNFAPDTITYFDHSVDPPKLYFVQRAAATAKTLAFADQTVQFSQDIRARNDLKITGMRIIYNFFLVDGSPATAIDEAGATSGPGVMQVTFDLRPPGQAPQQVPAVEEVQSLKTETVNVTSADWWFEHGDLEVTSADGIIVGEGSTLKLDKTAPENGGDDGDPGGCNKMIIEGAIPGWMNQDAHLKYVAADGYLTLQIWNDDTDHSKGYEIVRRHITLTFAATDLSTNDYTNTITAATTEGGTFDPESPPSGIAAAILAAQGVLQYEGSATLVNAECDLSWSPGVVLNISGGRDEWTAMKAQIQAVQHQIQTGTTSLTFGPAQHLAPQDYLQLYRSLMVLKPSLNLDSRAVGSAGNSGSGEVHHPSTQIRLGVKQTDNVSERQDTGDSGSSIKTIVTSGKMVLTDGTTTATIDCSAKTISLMGGGKSIVLDLDDLPDGAAASFQSVNFCASDGTPMTAKVLMTAAVPA